MHVHQQGARRSPSSSMSRRRRPAALAGALAAGLVLVGAGQAQAAAKATPTMTIGASPTTIAPNGVSTVSTVMKINNGPAKNLTVTFQQRYQGQKTWGTLARARTNSSGRAAARTAKRVKNVEYRAVYAGSRTVNSKASAAALVRVRQSVTVTSTSKTTITAGATITFSGRTSPALAKRPAALQILSGKTWKTVATATVAADSTFKINGRATQGGSHSYRVYVSGTFAASSAASAARTFKIYSWFYLSELGAVDEQGLWSSEVSDVTIGGLAFPKTVGMESGWDEPGEGSYNLSYRCTSFRATIGIDDQSRTGMTSNFVARVDDGAEQELGTLGLGRGKSITLSTAGGFRLHLENTMPDSAVGWAVWGNAQVLCLTKP